MTGNGRAGQRAVLTVSEEQVLWFRARRHLMVEGADTPAQAARQVGGLQAQQLSTALLSLAQRLRGGATAADLAKITASGKLVRIWGQRETLHLYDPADWGLIVSALREWPSKGRRGPMPADDALQMAREVMQAGPVTRKDLYDAVPEDYTRQVATYAVKAKMVPTHFAAGRLLFRMVQRGEAHVVGKRGAEQEYALRRRPIALMDGNRANELLVRRYLSAFGPSTPADIAHHLGARVRSVLNWIDGLVEVGCEGRVLLARPEDLEELQGSPGDWPLRLLPRWDTLLMGHKDKTWMLPAAEHPKVWRRAAYVAATVLYRGRIVATWSHQERKRGLLVTVGPLSGWRPTLLSGVLTEAERVATHLGLQDAEVRVAKG